MPATTVDVVIPVYNEEKVLAQSVETLHAFLTANVAFDWRIVIADNASTDSTQRVGEALAAQFPEVRYLRLKNKGRGRALRTAWSESDAAVVSYMDVDLSTNLNAYPSLVAALTEKRYDVAIGTRLKPASRTTRTVKREVISRAYNFLIKLMFWNRFSDAQCGFKALTRQAANELLPLVADQAWFFDTELLLLAERRGFRIAEVPVEWVEDLDSRVNIVNTALDDIKGLVRVRFS